MKILFLGDSPIINWINDHTDHEALAWRRLKAEEVIVPGGTETHPFTETVIVQCPMTNPDVIVNVGQGYVTYEMEAAMGLTKAPRKRVLYMLAAAKGRGGIYHPNSAEWMRNDAWFSQCIADKDHFKDLAGNILWDDTTDGWLPLPINIDVPEATVPTDELKMGVALGQEAASGFWNKGVQYYWNAYNNVGFTLDEIIDVTHEEALARKANCNLIWDSVQGGFGRSGLESMAQGIAVIAKIDPRQVACFEEVGANFPVISFTDQADLESKLTYYKTHLSELAAIGAASRAWMQTNYTPEKLAEYWTDKLTSL
jgi:hypothetical protein